MALFQELFGQGRVVGGHLANGSVQMGGATGFSKHGDLTIQHPSSPFRRHRINVETVHEWEELDTGESAAGLIGQAAAKAALPGRLGKSLGAGVGAAMSAGHTVRIRWVDGKESIVELPRKQFMLLSVMLAACQTVVETPPSQEPAGPSRPTGRLLARASAAFGKGNQDSVDPTLAAAPVQDVAEQIAGLASLHAQGVLTDVEFSKKKAELLDRP